MRTLKYFHENFEIFTWELWNIYMRTLKYIHENFELFTWELWNIITCCGWREARRSRPCRWWPPRYWCTLGGRGLINNYSFVSGRDLSLHHSGIFTHIDPGWNQLAEDWGRCPIPPRISPCWWFSSSPSAGDSLRSWSWSWTTPASGPRHLWSPSRPRSPHFRVKHSGSEIDIKTL